MPPWTSWPVAGSSATCPEAKTRSPMRTACEYGPMAAGACPVEIAVLVWLLIEGKFIVFGGKRKTGAFAAGVTELILIISAIQHVDWRLHLTERGTHDGNSRFA